MPFGNSSLLLGSVWCGTAACWNPVQVIVSLVYQVARKLLALPAVLLRRDVTKEAELLVLRHENAVLTRQLAGPRRVQPGGAAVAPGAVLAATPTPVGAGIPGDTRYPA